MAVHSILVSGTMSSPVSALPLVSAGLLAAATGLIAQGYVAGHRELPSFPNLDASGIAGGHTSDQNGDEAIRVVLLGDSTLTGPGLLDPAEIWIRQVGTELGSITIDIRSLALGGSRAPAVRREQLPRALELHPDLAIVSVGSNDSIRGVPLSLFRSEMGVIVNSLTASGAMVALAGIGDLATIPRLPQPLARLLKIRSNAYEEVHADLARGRPDVVKLPIRELASEAFRTQAGMFCPDLFHPSSRGHAAWAAAAHGTLERTLRHIGAARTRAADITHPEDGSSCAD